MTHVPLRELPEFVRNVRAVLAMRPRLPRAAVIALQGELGAGKTSFVQEFAKQAGVEDVVQSPTYVLMKIYEMPTRRSERGEERWFNKIVHIDAYRLEKPEEFDALRPQEFLDDPNALILVEWPERLGNRLPVPDIVLNFSADGMDADERSIEMEAKDGG